MEHAAESSSGLQLELHPLVLLNVSDHWTRTKAVQGGKPSRVLGCLLGHQHGRVVEIVNSFEVTRVQGAGGGGDDTGIDHEFLRKKQEQCAAPANACPRPRPPAGAAAARRPRRGRSTGARRA